MKLALVGVVAALLVPHSTQSPQVATVAEIAAAAYPAWLHELSVATENDMERQQCAVAYDTLPNGQPSTIVAAYTNGVAGAIRVLRPGNGTSTVIDEPRDLELLGTQCAIELLDIEGDGRREVHVKFGRGLDTMHWLFRWDGQRLTNVGPTRPAPVSGRPRAAWVNGGFIDTDLDGVLEFYGGGSSRVREGEAPPPSRVWRITSQGVVEGQPLVTMLEFVRDTGAPETLVLPVALPAGARGPYTLEIRNGKSDRSSRVTSGQVWLNGEEIVSPNDFRRAEALIQRSVALAAENDLSVRLAGEPGGRVLIIIRSAGWN